MTCLGFKGGIGTASRVLPSGHTVGVLVLANFGDRQRLTIDGVPAGRLLPPLPVAQEAAPPAGSCITVVLTDGPLDCGGLLPAGQAGRPGPGQDRVDGQPWQRRDLPRAGHRAAVAARCGARRAAAPARRSPAAASTRSSPGSSRPPRRRC